MAGAVGIVKIKNRSLRVAVGAAVAAGEQRVALDLDRTAFVGFDDQRNRAGARGHGGREILRLAKRIILRLLAERFEFFFRATAARTERRNTSERKRRGHQLQKITSAPAVFHPLARTDRKSVV